MKAVLKKIFNGILFLFARGRIADKAVDDGLCNFSGCGKDKYGHLEVDIEKEADKPRYIDANKIRLLSEISVDENYELLVPLQDVIKAIEQTPTSDVVERTTVNQ